MMSDVEKRQDGGADGPRQGPVRILLAGATGNVGRALAAAAAREADLELTAAVARSAAGRSLRDELGPEAPDVLVHPSVPAALEALRESGTGDDAGADVLVDYTRPEAVKGNVLAALEAGLHVVIGTSGLGEEDLAEIDAAARRARGGAGLGAFTAGNFAITAVLMQHFATLAARYVPHYEVIDYAKAEKPDAPSGTARAAAHALSQAGPPKLARALEDTLGHPEARGASLGGVPVHSLRLPGFLLSAEVIFGLPAERLSLRHDAIDSAVPYVAGTLLAVRKVAGLTGLVRGLDALMDLG